MHIFSVTANNEENVFCRATRSKTRLAESDARKLSTTTNFIEDNNNNGRQKRPAFALNVDDRYMLEGSSDLIFLLAFLYKIKVIYVIINLVERRLSFNFLND